VTYKVQMKIDDNKEDLCTLSSSFTSKGDGMGVYLNTHEASNFKKKKKFSLVTIIPGLVSE